MEAKERFAVHINDYGIFHFPKTLGENHDKKAKFLHVQKALHNLPEFYATRYKITMTPESPFFFTPSLDQDYDRILVEYEGGENYIVWCRQTQKTEIVYWASKYERLDGELKKVGDIKLPRQNFNDPLVVTIHGGMETTILLKDVWVSPFSGDIAPINWDNEDAFDSMDEQSDFHPSMLEFEEEEMHDFAEKMALAFDPSAQQAKTDAQADLSHIN